jgi:ribosomal protein S4
MNSNFFDRARLIIVIRKILWNGVNVRENNVCVEVDDIIKIRPSFPGKCTNVAESKLSKTLIIKFKDSVPPIFTFDMAYAKISMYKIFSIFLPFSSFFTNR